MTQRSLKIATISLVALSLIALSVAASLLGAQQISAAQGESVATVKSLSVQGMASIQVKPDLATLFIGVRTENAKSTDAQSENTKAMNAVIEALKKAGVKAEDIQTESYSMYEDHHYNNGQQGPKFYVVVNTVRVSTKQLDLVGKLLEVAGTAGANIFNGINFTLEDSSAVYNEALKLAYKSAHGKASALAAAMGVTIGKPIRVSESGMYTEPVLYRDASTKLMTAESESPTIESGTLTITAQIHVDFNY